MSIPGWNSDDDKAADTLGAWVTVPLFALSGASLAQFVAPLLPADWTALPYVAGALIGAGFAVCFRKLL